MKESTKNLIFRISLLALNAAMLGAVAVDARQGASAPPPPKEAQSPVEAMKADPESQTITIHQPTGGLGPMLAPILTIKESTKATSRKLRDGSDLTVMEDGHGGTTVTRKFKNHRRLRMVIIQTSSTGAQRIFVYGMRKGRVKTVPPDIAKRILEASADEIADAAKIYDGITEDEAKRIRVAKAREEIRRQAERRRAESTPVRTQPEQPVDPPADQPDSPDDPDDTEDSED